MDNLIEMYQNGGFFMHLLAALLFISTIIIVERLYMIIFFYSANSSKLMQKVQEHIIDNNIDKALNLCNSKKYSAIHQVFKAALLNADRPFDELQDHVEVASLQVVPKLQNRVPYLFTIANVATLLGLLGTIFGLIETFRSIGLVEAAQKQAMLSSGISTAMSTTAFGLVVAIPCMMVYGYLFNKINSMVDEIDHYSFRLLLLLRTGSHYFNKFSNDGVVTTKQDMQKKEEADSTENSDNDSDNDSDNEEKKYAS